jgi:hypothetical protein
MKRTGTSLYRSNREPPAANPGHDLNPKSCRVKVANLSAFVDLLEHLSYGVPRSDLLFKRITASRVKGAVRGIREVDEEFVRPSHDVVLGREDGSY